MAALTRSPHAEVTQSDEPATSSRAERNHWFEWTPYPRRDLSGRWNEREVERCTIAMSARQAVAKPALDALDLRSADGAPRGKLPRTSEIRNVPNPIEGLTFMDRILQGRYAT